ncbi:MAG: Calcium-dependent protease precursor [Planctomycetota bacterium]
MASFSTVQQVLRSIWFSEASRKRRLGLTGSKVESLEIRQLLVPPLILNSRPGAPVSVILDFDGHVEDDPDWTGFRDDGQTGPITTPPFDLDGDDTTFNAAELDFIREVWYRVAEDYAPFDINVTTVEPPSVNDFEAVFVSIGGDGAWAPPAGGWGILNGFSTGGSNTSYVFSELFFNAHQIASASSHESGHTFGLGHHSLWNPDGTKNDEYNPGDANRAPIMGVGYGTIRDVWDNGPGSSAADVLQDDLAVLTRPANRTVRFRPDDYGNTAALATRLNITSPDVLQTGVIELNDDADWMLFETDAGDISFSVSGLNLRQIFNNNSITFGTNLDLVLELRDSNGNLIARDNPSNSLNASVSANVPQGSYFIVVLGTGEYGALGQYTLTGNVIPLPTTPVMLGPTGTLADPLPVFTWTTAANVQGYYLEIEVLDPATKAYRQYLVQNDLKTTTFTPPGQFQQGEFRARVRALGNNDKFTEYSNYVSFTIDVPSPDIPTLLRPVGEISEPFPVFEWAPAQNAVLYNLWVVNRTTGQRVIFRTDYKGLTYVHFSALANGLYRAWLQATNSVGEKSPWSRPVDFSVAAPRPAAPQMLAPASTITDSNLKFVWTDVKAARYELQVNNLTTGQSRYLYKSDIPGTQTSFDATGFAQGVYVVWVRAFNGSNEAGLWSAALRFAVDILPPAAPTMTGPLGANGGRVITTLNPTYSWTAAARAERYELYVNNVTTGEFQVIRKNDITGLSFTSLVSQRQGEIRAWVRGINSANEAGDWSPVFTFLIDEATPLTPTIIAPVANPAGSVDNANPTFAWSIGIDAPFYQLELVEVNPNTNARTRVLLQNSIRDKFFTIPSTMRLKETTYVARVRGYNLSNEVGNWSPEYRVRIDVPDAVTPRILGPGNTISDSTPVLTWTHNSATIRYEVLIRDLIRNEVITLQVLSFGVSPGGSEAYYTIPDDKALKASTYRFWVRGFNSMQQPGGWSEPQSFVLTLSAAEPQIDAQLEPDVEILASLLPERRQPPVRQAAVERSEEVPPAEAAAVQLSAAEMPNSRSQQSVPETASNPGEILIDQAIWMLVNPATPTLPG